MAVCYKPIDFHVTFTIKNERQQYTITTQDIGFPVWTNLHGFLRGHA